MASCKGSRIIWVHHIGLNVLEQGWGGNVDMDEKQLLTVVARTYISQVCGWRGGQGQGRVNGMFRA